MAIVYVSNDHDQRQFNRNIAGKPFYSIPYTDLKTRQMLSTALQVASIPTLAITEPGTGLVVSFQGREQIFYHKRNKQPDPLEGWIGLGAEGNLLEQAKEKEEKAKAEAAGGSSSEFRGGVPALVERGRWSGGESTNGAHWLACFRL